MLGEDELKDAALLVFANKQDQPGAKGAGDISEALRLGELRDRNWSIVACSAVDGRGVDEGMDWLVVCPDNDQSWHNNGLNVSSKLYSQNRRNVQFIIIPLNNSCAQYTVQDSCPLMRCTCGHSIWALDPLPNPQPSNISRRILKATFHPREGVRLYDCGATYSQCAEISSQNSPSAAPAQEDFQRPAVSQDQQS